MINNRRDRGMVFILPVLVMLTIIFYLPVTVILLQGFRIQSPSGQSGFSLSWLKEIVSSTYYRRLLLFTFSQALLSTVLSLLLGLPGAWFLSHFDFPGKKVIKALSTIPFILPPILVVLGFILFWGKNGVVNNLLIHLFSLEKTPLNILYSFKAIILAHVFYNFPIALRLIGSWWEHHPDNQGDAARLLGASPWKVFRTVTLPHLKSGIISAGTLIFLYCFMSFAVVLVLGGGPRFSTLEVEVFRLIKYGLDFQHGGALAVMETAVTLILTFLYLRTERTNIHETDRLTVKQRWVNTTVMLRITLLLYGIFILILIAGPILTVIVQSFREEITRAGGSIWSLRWYRELIPAPSGSMRQPGFALIGKAIINSMIIAGSTTLITLITGTYISWFFSRFTIPFRTMIQSLIMLPMGVSSVVLGMGYLWMMRMMNTDALPVRLIIIAAHSVIALPFAVRSINPAMARISSSMLHSARLLGAGAIKRFFTLELPLIKSGMISAGAFAFAISLGEINATLILSDSGIITIPVAMYQLIGRYRFFSACALGTILIIICAIAFILIDTFEGWDN